MSTVNGDASRNVDLSGVNVKLTGSFFAFTASGGYQMERQFADITRAQDASFIEWDMTDTVQILYDVRTFNEAIGIYKDASNELVRTAMSDKFITDEPNGTEIPLPFELDSSYDSVTIDAATFKDQLLDQTALTGNPVVSIGVYEGMYTQFETYVRTYFGYFGGFASLFNNSTNFDISKNFDTDGMLELLTAPISDNGNGKRIADLSGSITISNITQLLRYAVDTNLFNNRSPNGESFNDSDTSYNSYGNFGVRDGFIADDLIFIREGTTINLQLDIAPESYLPINNLNTGTNTQSDSTAGTGTNTYLSSLGGTQNQNFTQTSDAVDLQTAFTMSTTATLHNIKRTLKAPLLIRLANLSGVNSSDGKSRNPEAPFGTSA